VPDAFMEIKPLELSLRLLTIIEANLHSVGDAGVDGEIDALAVEMGAAGKWFAGSNFSHGSDSVRFGRVGSARTQMHEQCHLARGH
jgi:hypothetical protein